MREASDGAGCGGAGLLVAGRRVRWPSRRCWRRCGVIAPLRHVQLEAGLEAHAAPSLGE